MGVAIRRLTRDEPASIFFDAGGRMEDGDAGAEGRRMQTLAMRDDRDVGEAVPRSGTMLTLELIDKVESIQE